MRYQFILIMVILLANCSAPQEKKVETSDEKQALSETIEKFNAAFRDGDVETLASMITVDYRHTNGNNKSIGKDSWLKYLRKRQKQLEQKELVVHDYQMSESEITFYGDMAILTAKISFSQTLNKEMQNRSFRVTNIWVKEKEQWKRAGFHDVRITSVAD